MEVKLSVYDTFGIYHTEVRYLNYDVQISYLTGLTVGAATDKEHGPGYKLVKRVNLGISDKSPTQFWELLG